MDSHLTEQCICGGQATWVGSTQTCDRPTCMFWVGHTRATYADGYCPVCVEGAQGQCDERCETRPATGRPGNRS